MLRHFVQLDVGMEGPLLQDMLASGWAPPRTAACTSVCAYAKQALNRAPGGMLRWGELETCLHLVGSL